MIVIVTEASHVDLDVSKTHSHLSQHHLSTIVTQHPRLSGNKLSAVEGNVFENLNNLNVLNLSHNRFHFVPIIAQNRFSLPLTYNCYCNTSFLQDNDDWGEKSQESEQPESTEVKAQSKIFRFSIFFTHIFIYRNKINFFPQAGQ